MPQVRSQKKVPKKDDTWKSRARFIRKLVVQWVNWLGLNKYEFQLTLETSEDNLRFKEDGDESCVAYIEIRHYNKIHIVIKDFPDKTPAYWEEVVIHELLHLLIRDLMAGTVAVMSANPNTKAAFKEEDENLTQALEMGICEALQFYSKPP